MPTQGTNPGNQTDNNEQAALSPRGQEAQRLLDQAYAHLDDLLGLPSAEAIEHCVQALNTFKRAREIAEELDEEEGHLRLAVRRGQAETYSQRGHQARYVGDHTNAVAYLSQALRFNPARAEDYYYRGLSYLEKDDLTQGRRDLTEYLRRGENDYLRERAKARIAALVPGKDDSEASLAHWKNEGIRLNGEASSLANPRGEDVQPNWLAAAKTYNQAIAAFDHALEAKPNDGMTRISLIAALLEQAKAYRHIDEYDLALQNYERAEQLRPNSLHSFLRGETLLEAGHPTLARAAFEQYLAEGNDRTMMAQAQKYLAAKPGPAHA